MFTGLIEFMGTVQKIRPMPGGVELQIQSGAAWNDLIIGESLAVDGVCLTITSVKKGNPVVEAVGETLQKTTIGRLKEGDTVNLERALRSDGRFGGHFVQGHVNGIGRVMKRTPRGENFLLEVEIPAELTRYLVPEGSVAINGVSLTVAALRGRVVGINLIPHTAKACNLGLLHPGDAVNVEVDIIAKYVEKLLNYQIPK